MPSSSEADCKVVNRFFQVLKVGVVVGDAYEESCCRCSFACCAAADVVENVWVIFDISPSHCCGGRGFLMNDRELVVALMKGVCKFD